MASSRAMSLATRCTSCGTIFKVVQDQLKVSEGWVRCGRCNEVFNALDGLFDLERDPPPQRPASAPPRAPLPEQAGTHTGAAQAATTRSTPSETDRASAPTQPMALDSLPATPTPPSSTRQAPVPAGMDDVPATNEDDALDSRWLLRSSSDGRSASERRSKQARKSDFTDARFPKDIELDLDEDSDYPLDPEPAEAPSLKPRPMPEIKGASKDSKGRSKKKPGSSKNKRQTEGTPSFVRKADRQAQWRHPAVRATLSGVALALLGLLVAQGGIAFRDMLSAHYPQARPYVAQLCEFAGCDIAPWHHIEDLAVDSVTLTRSGRATPGDNRPDDTADAAYKLNVVLHNRANVAIATPHVELSLTDSSGNLVSKRVLTPAEFGTPPRELPPGSNTSLQTRLASTGGRIAGYTVELFYP